LPSLRNKDFLGVQIETLRLNGQSTMLTVNSLLNLVTMLYNDVVHLNDDNAALKQQIENLRVHRLLTAPFHNTMLMSNLLRGHRRLSRLPNH
jgi:hypothetical protein